MYDSIISKIIESKKKPFCVGISGLNGAGKTTFSIKLRDDLEKLGKNVFLFSLDDYKAPVPSKKFDPDYYYEGWFDYSMIIKEIFNKIDCGRTLVRSRAWKKTVDFSKTDVIIFEGLFAFHPDLINKLDFKIYLKTRESIAKARTFKRDLSIEPPAKSRKKWIKRNIPAYKHYLKHANPVKQADVIITQ